MGRIVNGEYCTEGGRGMACLVREVIQVPPQPRARVGMAPARLSRSPRGMVLEHERGMDMMVRWSARRNSVMRRGMISFIHSEGRNWSRGVFIRDISANAMRVTRVHFRGVGISGCANVDVESSTMVWDLHEANLQESFELLGQLGRWRGPLTFVALSTAAALLLGFGPAAGTMGLGVSGLGGASVSLTTTMLINALSSALTTFIHQHYLAMVQAICPSEGTTARRPCTEAGAARFWESNGYSFRDILRQSLISGVGSGITSGVIRTPQGSQGFEAFLAHVVGRTGNAFFGVIQNLLEYATRNPGQIPTEQQIRAELLQSLIRDLSLRLLG